MALSSLFGSHESSARFNCGLVEVSVGFASVCVGVLIFLGDWGNFFGLVSGEWKVDVGLAGTGTFECFICSSALRGLKGGLGSRDLCLRCDFLKGALCAFRRSFRARAVGYGVLWGS